MDTMLFEPMRIRGVTLKNRIVLSPMLTYSAVEGNPLSRAMTQADIDATVDAWGRATARVAPRPGRPA